MKEIDYIVVGSGLAGISFCEQLRLNDKHFIVFDNQSQQSSRVAAGLYNPVVLKRFTPVWNAKSQLEYALPKYKILEDLLNIKLNYQLPILRRFTSIEEQNDWFTASDKPILNEFLSTALIKNQNPCINANFGFGEVLHSGRINSSELTRAYTSFLEKTDRLYNESFQYSKLKFNNNYWCYNDLKSKYIVFAEGYGIKYNPFFNDLPLNGTKGEMLTVKAPDLKMNFILKSSVFIVPLGDDLYWIGATYEWNDKTHSVTNTGKEELLDKLKTVVNCNYKVLNQVAGIRPTTKDRRPLVGAHPTKNNCFVLNGLGTRGVMLSPYVSEQLFNHIEFKTELDKEIDIKRFN